MTTTNATTEPIDIDIWADIACPWCYIGKARLQAAIDETVAENPTAQFRIRYHAFLLDPHAKPADGRTEADVLALKFGDKDKAIEALSQVAQVAQQQGLNFDFEGLVPTTTRPALRLLTHAGTTAPDRQSDLAEALYRAHFTDGKDVADPAVLIEAAATIGMSAAEVTSALESEESEATVARDLAQAREIGITGVPFFILGGKYSAAGAQPSELFRQAFQQLQQA